jgi:hypothetical protein
MPATAIAANDPDEVSGHSFRPEFSQSLSSTVDVSAGLSRVNAVLNYGLS